MQRTTSLGLFLSPFLLFTNVYAVNKTEKHAIKTNYQMFYNTTPSSVTALSKMFREGELYGRLRSNTFYYEWEKENAKQNTHLVSALGGSIVYKSATFNSIDFTAALYYSRAFFKDNDVPVNYLKSAKDTLSRYDYTNTGSKSLGVLGQAYLRYQGIPKTEILLGRQILETFYTKSNDSKMIPNTFDGLVVTTKAIEYTSVKIAYLREQKLRDHTHSHSNLTYGDSSSSASFNPIWSQNDDSVMHKGLTYSRLHSAGVKTNAPLILANIENKSLEKIQLNSALYSVPDLVSQVMAEANYKIKIDAISLSPGVRYIKQFDNGAGKIGGATYKGTLAGLNGNISGYKSADSLESHMIAARLVAKFSVYKLNLGYSQVFNESDLITPWRGFPTSGYTRSMARYNWMANTKSYRIELARNTNKRGLYKDMFIQMSILHTDADEAKGNFDENYYYLGFVQNIPTLENLQWRLRLGYNDTEKVDADSLDGRCEINYLF